jgi:hypothetical protein
LDPAANKQVASSALVQRAQRSQNLLATGQTEGTLKKKCNIRDKVRDCLG